MSNNFCSIDDVTTSSGNNSNRNLLDNLNFMNFHLLQNNSNSIDKKSTNSVSSSSPSASSAAVNYHWNNLQTSNNLDFTNNLISNNCKIGKDNNIVIPTGRSITGINYKKKLTTTSLDLEGMGSQTKTFGNGEGNY